MVLIKICNGNTNRLEFYHGLSPNLSYLCPVSSQNIIKTFRKL